MSFNRFSAVAVAACALAAGSAANAAVIEFSYTGIASGQWLNGLYSGQSFTNKAFTITARSLTDLVTPYADGYKTNTSGGNVTIADYGSFAVTSDTAVWVGNTFGRSGFGIRNSSDILSLGDSSFDTWNLKSSLGPITRTGVFAGAALWTTGGAVKFSGSTAMTFTATVVPAPSAVALIGLVGAVGARRRRA